MEVQMKLGIPAILIAALVVASPAAFAQNTGYTGTTSKPGVTKQSKKHMASHKKKHSAKHMTSKPQTTGPGSASTVPATTRTKLRPSRDSISVVAVGKEPQRFAALFL
jgi:hypothetical protein